ncbi:MAG: hypothetical protein EHM41_03585 [Chloroflexi bacterium]|nr:MAG: hypothetical protein EHM41_03585 [Chloroflexota bacterium]
MNGKLSNFWKLFGKPGVVSTQAEAAISSQEQQRGSTHLVEFDQNDPVIQYFQSAPGVVEIEKLIFDSPTLRTLKAAGVKLTVPLVSQGELIGLLNLGPRLSEQEYSADDHGLLNNLATQAAPALRVAQLVREQQIEVQARERIEHELRVARLIQQTLLPKGLPDLPGWQVATYYQPARAVGGDFFDFIPLKDGRYGFVIGDVTDKGVPAALVMATTRSVLRSAAEQFSSPGKVLERANDLLCPDIPERMFITCIYAILDPNTGHMVFANAGHDLPYRRCGDGVEELRATGMPLGLMEGMEYEQKEIMIGTDETILFYSDGLVEAHNPSGEMFGFPRLREKMAYHPGGKELIEYLLDELKSFTSTGWEQEDDVTFLILERTEGSVSDREADKSNHPFVEKEWQTLAEFSLASEPGNEREATRRVAEVVESLNLDRAKLERLKTAVAEAAMNAMEHGNKYQPDLPVKIRVQTNSAALSVQITDYGTGQQIPQPEIPNLEAKLAGEQTSRGWGLFLIKNMVDELNVTVDEKHHTVELVIYQEGGKHG